jgi:hypothetical protein
VVGACYDVVMVFFGYFYESFGLRLRIESGLTFIDDVDSWHENDEREVFLHPDHPLENQVFFRSKFYYLVLSER